MKPKSKYKSFLMLRLSVFIGVLGGILLNLSAQEAVKIVRPHSVNKIDLFGRNYKQKWNGEILFALDDSYREALPDASQLDVHIAEAKELVDKRKYFPAIRLLKGITLCQRLVDKDKKTPKFEVQNTLNRLLSENQDRKDELEILTEPYGCYAQNKKKEKKLFIESKDFSYRYEIDERFRYVFPTELYRFARKEREYNWKVSYFRIFLPEATVEQTFESEYFRYDKEIFYEPPARIMFSIGQTFHKHTLADNSHYPDIWDGRRGLSSAVKRASGFLRKEISSGIYETNFNLSDETQTRNYAGFETYRFSKSTGLGVFLTCPTEVKEECARIWKEIK
jgi:hypothetical protein